MRGGKGGGGGEGGRGEREVWKERMEGEKYKGKGRRAKSEVKERVVQGKREGRMI